VFPLVEELSPVPDIETALSRFADLDGVLLLESAARHPRLGRYSFLTADPFRWFKLPHASYGVDPLIAVREAMQPFATERVEGLPPFQGGAAGMLGYELGQAWERLPRPATDGFREPVLAVGLYDWTIAWDHVAGRAWIISQGFPATDDAGREQKATDRLQWVKERLIDSGEGEAPAEPHSWNGGQINACGFANPSQNLPGVTSTFSREDYIAAVQKIIKYIRAGDVFQVNLSQRLLVRQEASPLDVYRRLRALNPAPFAGYFAADDWVLMSSSPERFLAVDDRQVETRPIKGTRRRSLDPTEDDGLKSELMASAKDRAENVMIVDLLRNDLSRVCRPTTVKVPELCSLETYETVHHLVSSVVGELAAGRTVWDLFAAAFPGGSITGAPKIRAMEIIAELEPVPRGPYCGSLFYAGFDGTCDSSILIRTMIAERGWIRFSVGGGVTARSDAEAEYDETLHKASGMLKALGRGGAEEDRE